MKPDMQSLTDQESLWAGEFGSGYCKRNNSADLLASNISLFSRILRRAKQVRSVLEFGPNIGLNLLAIHQLLPSATLAGVEVNQTAFDELVRSIPIATAYHDSACRWPIDRQREFVFTKGLLIHVAPEDLPSVYQKLYEASSRYIMVAEYYSPVPVSIPYRGHSNQLFKRDFAGELLDRFAELAILDYGFVWHRDPNFPQDDLTWFLMEKR